MTDTAIQEQIETIRRAAEKATKSKETALKFLTDAGIVELEEKLKGASKKKK